MKKINIQSVINIILALWVGIWFYYLLFNWDVFIIQLNTNFGFNTYNMYPFVFFFFIGLIGFVIVKYAIHYSEMQNKGKEEENKSKTKLLEKDIEILKLKEVLFKMQSEGMNKSASTINALHAKLDSLSKKYNNENEEITEVDRKEEKE
jgi:hypothetical protein